MLAISYCKWARTRLKVELPTNYSFAYIYRKSIWNWITHKVSYAIKYQPTNQNILAQSAGTAEYTGCISAEEWDSPPNKCLGYDTKQSGGEALIMMELWGMQSTSLLPSLPGSFWLGVIAPDRVLSMCQIELNCVITQNWIV